MQQIPRHATFCAIVTWKTLEQGRGVQGHWEGQGRPGLVPWGRSGAGGGSPEGPGGQGIMRAARLQ